MMNERRRDSEILPKCPKTRVFRRSDLRLLRAVDLLLALRLVVRVANGQIADVAIDDALLVSGPHCGALVGCITCLLNRCHDRTPIY